MLEVMMVVSVPLQMPLEMVGVLKEKEIKTSMFHMIFKLPSGELT